MTGWKRNVAVIWLAQFFSIMGFSFALPFAPFYLQQLGVTDAAALKFWVSAFAAATPLTLAIFSPIWGHLSDRVGRRVMMLRAYVGGAAVLLLMGLASRPWELIVLRLAQGIFTGTITAAQTMVSVSVPKERSGAALGLLSAAVSSGSLAGMFFGGLFSEWFGCQGAFFCSSGFLTISTLLTVFGTRSEPVALGDELEEAEPARARPGQVWGAALPILCVTGLMTGVRQFDGTFMPLLVQEINQGMLEGSAARTGMLAAAGAVAGVLASVGLGRIADRIHPSVMARVCAVGAAILLVPQGLATGFLSLFPARFGMAFFAGGLDPIFLIWLAKVTPEERRGALFGWAGTARAVGWAIAPMLSGVVASHYGIRTVFFAGAGLYLLLVPCVNLAVKRMRSQTGNPQPIR